MKEKIIGLKRKAVKVLCLCVSMVLLAGCGEESNPVLPESIQMREPEESKQEEQSQAQDTLKSSENPTESASETQSVQHTEEPSAEASRQDGSSVQPTEKPSAEASRQDGSSVQPTEEPSSEEVSKDNEQTATPKPRQAVQDTEENRLAREAYKVALTKILDELTLPDGEVLYYDGFFEFSQNKFAIADVDGDGKEELIFSYNTGPMAYMNKYVYGYNAETDTVHLQLDTFRMTFYDNGIVKSDSSHNHGRGDKLWPYAVYYYNENQDNYHFGVNVDSWEKEYYGDSARGQTFPTEADIDGDGVVYYLMEYDDYSYENPIDGAEYRAWYEELLKDAEVIELEYKKMTKENIAEID